MNIDSLKFADLKRQNGSANAPILKMTRETEKLNPLEFNYGKLIN